MTYLIAGLVLFLGAHTVPMLTGLRAQVAGAVGDVGYKIAFAIVSAVGLILIIMGYGALQGSGDNPIIWVPPVWTRHLSLLLMVFAMIALVAAYVPSRIRDVLKHPMLVAVKIWALSHLLANGDLASMLLFGTFLVWAVFDRISVKKRGSLGPLGAKSGGLVGDVIAVVLGLALYAFLLLYGHLWLFNAHPLPSLMA